MSFSSRWSFLSKAVWVVIVAFAALVLVCITRPSFKHSSLNNQLTQPPFEHSSPNNQVSLSKRSDPFILSDFDGTPSSAIVSKFANEHDFSSSWMEKNLVAIDQAPSRRHRKQWELAYIVHIVSTYGLCTADKHGMVWAAGKEPLISYFANQGCNITASDMDVTGAVEKGWSSTNQHSANKEHLWVKKLVEKEVFEKNVKYRTENMNFVPSDLILNPSFDFVWSTCSVEHVGSITLGMRFIINAMDTIKPGGFAIHTTEFTLSSLDKTVDSGPTVLWRKKDILRLERDLIILGYEVFPIDWKAGELQLDKNPDLPPFRQSNHIKLLLSGHVATSFCIIIKKPLTFKQ